MVILEGQTCGLQANQAQYMAMQQYVPCKHQGCPICAEENERQWKACQALAEQKASKAEDYKNRCREYLISYRKGKTDGTL